jgi:DNA-binding IclR family transcriptional regulator
MDGNDRPTTRTRSTAVAARRLSPDEGSKTLDRGVRVLRHVCDNPGQRKRDIARAVLDAEDAAAERSVLRCLLTLEAHGLLRRDEDSRWWPDAELVRLARPVGGPVWQVGRPEMERLASMYELSATMTAVLSFVEGREMAVAIHLVEPPTGVNITYRPGNCHPLEVGAAGLAILLSRPEGPNEPAVLARARQEGRGWVKTHGELQLGAVGVAAPIREGTDPAMFSIGLVGLQDLADHVGDAVAEAAARIARKVL